jgi:hypothetical protein
MTPARRLPATDNKVLITDHDSLVAGFFTLTDQAPLCGNS